MLVSVAEQIQPRAGVKLLKVQSVFALKLGGLMISIVSSRGQCHGTLMVLDGPVKMRLAVAGQVVSGINAFTCIV
jgi:hypothetical protein